MKKIFSFMIVTEIFIGKSSVASFTLTFLMLILSLLTSAQVTFQKTYGASSNDASLNVKQTSDNGYVLVGSTDGFSAGSFDVYLVRTNEVGDILWTKTYGSIFADYGIDVQQTSDNGFIVLAYSLGFGSGNGDILLIRTDASGDTLWTRAYGGSNNDQATVLLLTDDGGFLIGGYVASFGAGMYDLYLLKTDADGNVAWSRTYGSTGSEYCLTLEKTSDGGFIAAGQTDGFGAGLHDVYAVRINSSGDSLWTKTYGGSADDVVSFVYETDDHGFILAGYTSNFGQGGDDVYVIRTDSSGDTLFTKCYGGAAGDFCYRGCKTSDGNFVLAGATTDFGSNGVDVYLLKLNVEGDTLWTQTFGGASDDYARSVCETADGGVIVAGYTASWGAGSNDAYLIKTVNTANSGCNQKNTSTIISQTATQLSGTSSGVNSGCVVIELHPAVGEGGIATTSCLATSSAEILSYPAFSIAPNPIYDRFVISTNKMIRKGTIQLYNVMGEKILQEEFSNESTHEVNVFNISPGIYLLKLHTKMSGDTESYYSKKLIVR